MSQFLLKNLTVSFPGKLCFSGFDACVGEGSRIAVVGRNGCGKSALLKIICGIFSPSYGSVQMPRGSIIGYVPQLVENFQNLSGGQRFHKALTGELAKIPDILLLDEPTNHLDSANKRALIRMLQNYAGSLIIASHDRDLLCSCVDKIWHIDEEKVHVFAGRYDDYMASISIKRAALERELDRLQRQKSEMHNSLIKEQQRAAKSRAAGKKKIAQRRWLHAVADNKVNAAEKSAGKNFFAIENKKQRLAKELSDLRLPEVIVPKFSLPHPTANAATILSISDGSAGYGTNKMLLGNINFSLKANGRMALVGQNGCGKSTIINAILGNKNVLKTGNWLAPRALEIGYLDQHYTNLSTADCPIDVIAKCAPQWTLADIRKHLSTFLFRKPEEVTRPVGQLSGGEKARLSLAKIATKVPKLLLLDEMTNNLDVETREHVIQVLKGFPGALLAVSHDTDFLEKIGIQDFYDVALKNM